MRRIVTLAAGWLCLSTALAGETLIPVPDGMVARPPVVAVSGDRIAVAFHPSSGPRVASVIQTRGSEAFRSELPGTAWRLEYSADGSRLLVGQSMPGPGSHGYDRTTLLDDRGEVLWVLDPDRAWLSAAFFSTTGESIGSRRGSEGPSPDGRVEIRSLDGSLVRTVDLGDACDLVLVVGKGERIIAGTGRSLFAIDVGEGTREVWRVELGEDGPALSWIRALGPDRFAAGGYGGFHVFDTDGSHLYVHDATPDAHFPYAGPTPDSLFLFDHDTSLLRLDLSDGAIRTVPADLSVPAGYRLYHPLLDGRLVLTGERDIVVRALQ